MNKSFLSFICTLAFLSGCSDEIDLKIFCKGNKTVLYVKKELGIDEQITQENRTYIFKNKSWDGVVKCEIWNEDEINCYGENNITEKGRGGVNLDRISGKITEKNSKKLHEEILVITFYEGICEKNVINKI